MTCEQAGSLAITTNLAGINNVAATVQACRQRCACSSRPRRCTVRPASPMDDALGLPQPNNRYGLSKWLGEQLVEYEVRSGDSCGDPASVHDL